MSKWGIVSVNFDISDETKNFGTRAVAVSNGAVYESVTIATIQTNEEELAEFPSCTALFSFVAGVVIASEKSLTLFDSSFTAVKFTKHFDSPIECVELSQNEVFLFCGLSDGTFICLDAQNDGQVLFSKSILGDDILHCQKTFARINSKCTAEYFEVYAMLTNGMVLKAYHYNMEQLLDLTKSKQYEEFPSVITFSVLRSSLPLCKKMIATQFFSYDDQDVVLMIDQNVALWSAEASVMDIVMVGNPFNIIQIEYAICSNHFICLCRDGYLLVICGYSFQVINKWEQEKIKTFTLIHTGHDIPNQASSEMIIITESDQPELCLIELPAFEIKLRLKVCHTSYIVEKQTSSEDVLYIEGFGDNSLVNTLRLKSIIECSPDFRLERLLQRRKFQEAELFARNLKLNLESVYKAKVIWLKDKLSLMDKNSLQIMESYNELLVFLDKIQNVEFVAECCLKVMLPDLKMTQHMFDYAIKRLCSLAPNYTDNILVLLDKVTNSNITLGTYIQVNEDVSSSENWMIFYKSNPIMICRNLLLRNEIEKAVIVCRRHMERFKKELPTGVALELLQNIPTSVPIDEVLIWLRVYIPVLLGAHPDLLQPLIAWIIDRTKSLGRDNEGMWPGSGLYYVNGVIDILSELPIFDAGLNMPLSLEASSQSSLSICSPLLILGRHIHQLSVLKREYSISVDFEEYLRTIDKHVGPAELIYLILANVGEETLPTFIPGFFTNFCAKNYLDKDFVLYSYVEKMLRQSSPWWDIESSWELRVISFIGYIQSTQFKIEAIEKTVANVKVPWSNEIVSLAKNAMKIDHPIAEQIYEHMKSVPLKFILRKYGLSKTEEGFEIHDLIRYILKKNEEGMIDEAKQLVKFSKNEEKNLPYFLHLLYAIESGDIGKGLVLIKSELDNEQIVNVTKLAISYLISLTQYSYVVAECEVIQAIRTLFSTLKALNPQAVVDLEKDIRLIAHRTIKKTKNKKTILPLYKTKVEKEIFLRDYLVNMSGEATSNLDKLTDDAGEIAVLLDLPRHLSLLEMGFVCISKENLPMSIQFLRLMLEIDDSLYVSHSKRILDLISLILNLISCGRVAVEDDDWETIKCVLRKIYILSDARNVVRAIDLLSFIKLCCPPEKSIPNVLFKHLYTEQIESPVTVPPVSYCKRIIEGCSTTRYQDFSTIQKDVEKSLQLLPHTLSSIHRLQNILWTLFSLEEFKDYEKITKIVEEKVLNILPRIIFSRNLDLELALGLLCLIPLNNGISWLLNHLSVRRENWGNLKNASAVALVGKHFVTLTIHGDQLVLQKRFAEYFLKFECFKRLQRFGIAPKVADTYCDSHDGKRTLLLKLMKFCEVDVNFLHSVCQDLTFDFQECLLLYLEHTLLTWEAHFEETVNPMTDKSEIILLSKKEDLALKCSQIEALTTMKDELVDYLKKVIFPKVNFYHYEVFMVIIDIILSLSPSHREVFLQHQLLLSFLIPYRRISPVSSEETDNWFHCFPDLSALPRISKYRLPFGYLPSDPWKIIRPELTLKTYKLWLNAPEWLNVTLDKDIICSFTIMNMIPAHVRG